MQKLLLTGFSYIFLYYVLEIFIKAWRQRRPLWIGTEIKFFEVLSGVVSARNVWNEGQISPNVNNFCEQILFFCDASNTVLLKFFNLKNTFIKCECE